MPENICKDNKKVDINQTFPDFFFEKPLILTKIGLFSPEISWNFAPFIGLPFDYRVFIRVVSQPRFSPFYHLIQFLCLVIADKGCLAMMFSYP